MTLEDAAARVATRILEHPRGTRWFIDCDTDADGLCGAAVIAKGLMAIGHSFQIRPSRGKTTADYQRLADEACDGFILVDKGSSHLETLAALQTETRRTVIVIDHHNVPARAPVTILNPRLEGLDGSRDASASTTAVALATALGAPESVAAIGLPGAIGDWQHEGGWQGYNLELVQAGLASGAITKRRVLRLIGVDLAEALRRAGVADPGALLKTHGIDPHVEAEDLDREQAVAVASAWTQDLLRQGRDPPETTHEVLWDPDLDVGLRQCFRIVDACGRLGDGAAGIAFLFGHGKQAALDRFLDYKARLGRALGALLEGTKTRQAIQWASVEDPALTGMAAGIGMVHGLEDRTRPVLVRAPREDGWQVSTRGTHEQVAAGMDLGVAIAAAASSVGHEGGGHPIASGAVIPDDAWPAFLEALDEALMAQGFMGGP